MSGKRSVKIMNMLSVMGKINAVGRYLLLFVLAVNLISLASGSAINPLKSALKDLCTMSQTMLGVVAMVLVVLAGTTYAIGQVLGAETRARAAVWATAMLTGAVIGAVIYIVTPTIVKSLLPGTAGSAIDASKPCDIS